VEAALEDMKSFFPAGLKAEIPYDTTPFVRVSIKGWCRP
jgi:multidrug efflux pump